MDDMQAFEQRVAGEVIRVMGPPEPVDDVAIFDDIAFATQSTRWRFQSLFSATKLAAAALIVALFGGFLLSGFLPEPSDDPLPVGASASATTQTEPTDAATSEPEPTAGVRTDDTTAPDLLPGVDLVTEVVEPGVYRVLSDGVRHLSAVDDPAIPWGDTYSLVIDRDGGVWRVGPDRAFFRLGDPATHEWTEEPALVGDEDIAIGPGGTVWSANEYRPDGAGKYMHLMSYDGTSWSDEHSDLAVEVVEVAPDGTVWACCSQGLVQVGADGLTRWPVPATITARSFFITEDGARWFSTTAAGNLTPGIVRDATDPDVGDPSWERFGLELDERLGRDQNIQTAISPDGIAWMHVDGGIQDEHVLARLEHDEWSTWTGADGVPPHIQTESWWGRAMSAAPDGSVWLVSGERDDDGAVCDGQRSSSDRRVSRFDGTTWSHYLEGHCIHALEVTPDGNAWVRAGRTGAATDPVEFYVITPVTGPPSPSQTDEPPGELVTEDVEPGVVRVISDGHRTVSWTGNDLAAEEPGPLEASLYPSGASRVIVRDDGRVWVVVGRGFYELGHEPMVRFPGQDFMLPDDQVAVGPNGAFYKLLGWRPQSWKPAGRHELWRYDGSGWAPEEIEPGSATAERLWTAPDGSIRARKGGTVYQRHDSGWVRTIDTSDSGEDGTPGTTEDGTQPLVRLGGTRAASPDNDDEEVCAGLDRLDGEASQHYLTDLCIFDFDIGPDGRIWAIADDEPRDAGSSGGLYIIDPGAITPITEAAVKEPPSTAQGRQRPSASPKEDIVRKTMTPAATALALGLLASAAPAVAAQDEIIAPIEFTAHVSQVTDCSSLDFEGVVDGIGQHRGYRCKTTVEDSSDPRFSGTWLLVFSEDGYGEDDGTGTGGGADTVWTYEYRVENDDGAWQSGPVSGVEFDEREMMVAPVFTGEGAYEGLTAIVEMSDRETDVGGASDASLRGAIFVGSPPPPSGFPSSE